jgi:cytochrome b6-f complex iron-sulfur subunit
MADVDPGRRKFIRRLMRVLGVVAILEAGWISLSVLVPGRRKERLANEPDVEVAGPVERFEPGSVTAFPNSQFYLVRLDDGGFLAIHRKCTHLGCIVPWGEDEQRFACPCHASAFDIRGDVVNAPAPRPLDIFPVTVDKGMVMVDTSRMVRRREFDASQVTRA